MQRNYRDRIEAIAAGQRAIEASEDREVWNAMRWLAIGGAVLIVALRVILG